MKLGKIFICINILVLSLLMFLIFELFAIGEKYIEIGRVTYAVAI